MRDVEEFFSNLFDKSLWPPRWHCGYWSDFHGWLYIISDVMIWAAYFTIPIIILQYISRKKNVRFHKAYICFAAFILACGLTHLVDAAMFWIPVYKFNALMRFLTAIISWLTVYQLFKLLPTISSTKTADELETEIKRNMELLAEVENSNLELKKQNTLIENIFNASTDHVNVFDTQLNFISANSVTLNFLKKSKDEIVGKNFEELFPVAVGSEYHDDLRHSAEGASIIKKITVGPSGRSYESSFKPLFENDKQYGCLVISRDITDTVKKEETLQELNNELSAKNKELISVNAELEQFTYILSHDLQEPIRKILVYSDLAMKEGGGENDRIQKIQKSAEKMKALITNVLEYSKTGKTEVISEKIKLDELLNDVLSDLELSITEKKAVIIAKTLPELNGVKFQIAQVFYNLVANALKYCDKEPCLEITHSMVTKKIEDIDKQFVEINFKDNGIGFDHMYKEAIFTPFKRLQTNFEGTGIGLALVKRIIENHNGYVDVESKIGEGSVFKIGLPV